MLTKFLYFQVPRSACISSKCKNLLTSLLKHDPDERIGFEGFFGHNFLDLAYLPTPENYLKVVNIVQEAINFDKKKNYMEALEKYREGIKYVQAFIEAEVDVNKKFILNIKLKEYIRWANTLTEYLQNNSSVPNYLCQPLPISEDHFGTLCELAAMTPSLATALDIGSTGELYVAEGQNNLALEKLTIALELLISILGNEPIGARKDMLHSQVSITNTRSTTFNPFFTFS